MKHNATMTTGTPSSTAAFSFGIIADVQWADADDGFNYAKTSRRCYRGALATLGDAVHWWRGLSTPPLFVAQLGDLIDGMNNAAGLDRTDAALARALSHLGRLACPSVNLIGNHEMYNFDRRQLANASWLRHGDKEYYSFRPAEGWRMVVLDSYQISLMGHSEDDPRRLRAVEIIARENPRVSPDGRDGDWLEGIEGHQRRFVPFNGGYGPEQLEWLRSALKEAADRRERVMVLSHNIIHPEACGGTTMAWDYEEALDIIRSEEASGCVAAVLCGHDHRGNYHRDECGVHHLTFVSPLSGGKAFGLMVVTNECLEIRAPIMNEFLPDVEGRPFPTVTDDSSALGPCETIKLQLSKNVASSVSKEKEFSPCANETTVSS